MSASREKKVRQDAGQELTEKQLKIQKEQQQAKRNRVIYTVVGAVSAVLVAALLIWNSGFFQNRTVALTIGGKDYTVGQVQYYYTQIYNQYAMYGYYGMVDFDPSVSPKAQAYDKEQTWHDYFINNAIQTMAEYTVIQNAANAEGYTLTDEDKESIKAEMDYLVTASAQNQYASVASYLKSIYGGSMTPAIYEKMLEEYLVVTGFTQKYSDALSYTDADLEKYYADHKDELDEFNYNYVYISGKPETKKDADGKEIEATDAEKKAALDAAKDKAESILAMLVVSGDLDKALEDYKEDKNVTKYSDITNDGSRVNTLYSEWMKKAERKAGDTTMVDNADSTGYYVIQYLGRERDAEITADIRHILIAAEVSDGATTPTDAQYEAAKDKAQKILDDFLAAKGGSKEFAELAEKNSADTGSSANGGLYEQVSSDSGFISAFTDWALDESRKPGDTGLVKNTGSSTKGWHIMYYEKQNEELWKITVRNALIDQDTLAWVEGLLEKVETVKGDGLKYVG